MDKQDEVVKNSTIGPTKRRRGRSLFAPIVLISAGGIFLAANLGLIGQPDWTYALSYWPLLLICLGIDILVTQLRAPGGTFLSLLVSLVTVGVFGFLLFAGPNNPAVRSLGISTSASPLQEVPFSVPVEGADAAEIEIGLGNYPSTIGAGAANETLISGSIWTRGDLLLDIGRSEGSATITVGEKTEFESFLNPSTWFAEPGDHTWRFNLNDGLPLNLRISAGNGSSTLDLQTLSLSKFELNSANGSIAATLPGGVYDGQIEGANGSLNISLPPNGRQNLHIDSGNGSVRLVLLAGVPARIEFDTGNGSMSVDDRFELVEGDRQAGVYQTADYSSNGDGVLLHIDAGNGSVQISQP